MEQIDRPMFNPYSFVDGERDSIRRISVQLGFLVEFEEDFQAAVALIQEVRRQMNRNKMYGYAKKNQAASRWKSVVARDGAVTLYKIQDVINNINTSLKEVPEFCKHIDEGRKNAAAKSFRLAFPDTNIIRQAVTHTPDIAKSSEKFGEHTLSGNYDDGNIRLRAVKHIVIHASVSGDVFNCSYRGKAYQYTLSQEVADILNSIVKNFVDAFNSASIK